MASMTEKDMDKLFKEVSGATELLRRGARKAADYIAAAKEFADARGAKQEASPEDIETTTDETNEGDEQMARSKKAQEGPVMKPPTGTPEMVAMLVEDLEQRRQRATEDQVRKTAYDIWLARGAPVNTDPEQDWFEAQRRLGR